MRPVDRERLPIGGAVIAVWPMMAGIAPMAWRGLIVRDRGRRRLGGFRYNRRTRDACRRLGLRRCRRSGSRRRGCVFGVAGKRGADHKQSCDGKAGELGFHGNHPALVLELSFRDAPTELGSPRVRQVRRPSRQQPTWMRRPGIMVAKNHFAGAGSVGAAGGVASGALAGVASVAAAGAASFFLAEAIREVSLCTLATLVERPPW